MGIGVSLLLIAAGAVIAFATKYNTIGWILLAVGALGVLLSIIFWSTQKSTARDRWLCLSLGLILAGTLGNFYDRILFNGVRDFLHWNYHFDWPVFNIADCCLVVGACLLLVQAFFAPVQQPDKKKAEADKESLAEPVGTSS